MTRAFDKIAEGLRDCLPIDRKHDWQAEHRYLSHRVQEDSRRIAELEEMLAAFFPEVRS